MAHDWQTLGTIAVKDEYSLELIRRTEKELVANDIILAAKELMTPRKFEDVEEHLSNVSVYELFVVMHRF
jgi:hypothetical protein